MNLEWVTNDRKDPEAPRPRMIGDARTPMQERADYLRWRREFVEGSPQVPPGSDLTVERLEAMGLVGLYRRLDLP